jgi:hypothetical protein
VLFAFLGSAAPAAAQDTRLFQIEGIDGFVELGFVTSLDNRSRRVSNSSDADFNRVELSQILDLNTYGFIYHPRLVTFSGGIRLEGIEGLAGQSDTRLLVGGDFRFNFLETHPNSLSIFGRVQEAQVTRPFAKTYDVTNQLYGATFIQKWGWIPFNLSYQHREESGGVSNDLDNSTDEVIFRGNYRIGEQSDGSLDYNLNFDDIQGRDVRRQRVVANNLSYFGDELEKRLYTNLVLAEEKDGRQLYNVIGSTKFTWRHSDDFWTRYVLNGRWSDSEVQNATIVSPSFYLAHQLYDSLRSNLNIFGRAEEASFRSRYEYGVRIKESYRKYLGEWGRLNVSVSPHVAVTYNRPDETTAFVFDEIHQMVGLDPVQLQQPDIIESTIVVTNQDGSIVYDRGPLGDYIVNQVGGGFETELVRTPISDILNGEVVRVDYEYKQDGDNELLTTGVGAYTSLSFFDHWNVFGRYDKFVHHTLSGDEDDLRLNDFTRYSVGLTFDWPWCTARAEFVENDSSLGPFRGYDGSVSFFTYGMETWHATLTAGYAYRDYTDDAGDDLSRLTMSATASKRLFLRGLLEAEGSWLRGRWSGSSSEGNDIDSMHFKLKYSWWYGKVEVKLETGIIQVLRPVEDRRAYLIDLRVRRVF